VNVNQKLYFIYHISRTFEQYVAPGVLLAEQLHCAYNDIACFRAASVDNIIAAQNIVNNMVTSLDLILFFEPWVPVIDNVIVHGQLYETVQNTSFPLKPLVIGTLTEETLFFIYSAWNQTLSPRLYSEIILAFFRTKAVKVLERYPPSLTGDQRPLLSRIATQWVFACTNRIFTRKAASYSYVFGFPLDFDGWGFWTFCNGHVCHAAELPYVYESAWANFTDVGRRVSQSMATYWTNFAKSQNPNEPLRVTTPWPRVTTGNENYMYFQDPLQVQTNYLKADCDFWDEIGYKREYF
jgi:carboxylesterase type B